MKKRDVSLGATGEGLPEGRVDQGECDVSSAQNQEGRESKPGHHGITGPKCKVLSEDMGMGTWLLRWTA